MKIETRKIKYVIAREGLIIILLMLCAGASYYVNDWQTSKVMNYVNSAKELHLMNSDAPDQKYGGHFFSEDKVQFPKSTSLEIMKYSIERDFPGFTTDGWTIDANNNTNISARYDGNGNKVFTSFPWNIDFMKTMAFFLFIAYPAYLLIRFVVWSVITIKNKEK